MGSGVKGQQKNAPGFQAGVCRPGNICGDGTVLLTSFPLSKTDLLLLSGFGHCKLRPSVSPHSGLPGPHFPTCQDSSCCSEDKVITQGDPQLSWDRSIDHLSYVLGHRTGTDQSSDWKKVNGRLSLAVLDGGVTVSVHSWLQWTRESCVNMPEHDMQETNSCRDRVSSVCVFFHYFLE